MVRSPQAASFAFVSLVFCLKSSSFLCHSAFPVYSAEPVELTPSNEDRAPNYKVVVGLCAAVSLICSIDRASISVAIVPMAEQYGWSDSAKGAISSSFFLGYTITNLIGTYMLQSQHAPSVSLHVIPLTACLT